MVNICIRKAAALGILYWVRTYSWEGLHIESTQVALPVFDTNIQKNFQHTLLDEESSKCAPPVPLGRWWRLSNSSKDIQSAYREKRM